MLRPGAASATAAARRGPLAALVALALAMLLASLGTSSPNVGLPTIAHALDASFQEVRWIVLAYLIANTSLLVIVGRLGDTFGRRRLLLTGLTVFTAGALLCGLAPTLPLLVAARVLQGTGAATMMALSIAFIGETVPKSRTGRAMGLLGTTSAVGTALGPSVGGLLIAAYSWRAIFLAVVPLGLVALLFARRYLPADRPAALAERIGVEGSVRLVLAMLRDRKLSSALAMSTLVSTVMMATLVVGPFYLSRTLGLQSAAVGLVLSVGPVVTALTGIPAGRLADRFSAARVTALGLVAIACGAAAIAALPTRLGVLAYVVPIAVMTAGYGLFQTANNTAVMAEVSPATRGVTSGLLNFSRNLGLIAGASLMGSVFALTVSRIDRAMVAPAAVAAGMRATFAIATALIVVALTIALTTSHKETVMNIRRRITSSLVVLSAVTALAPHAAAQTKTDTVYVTQTTPSWSIGAVSVQLGAVRLGLTDLNAAMIANGRPAVASDLATFGVTGHARFGRFIVGGSGEAANQRRIGNGWSNKVSFGSAMLDAGYAVVDAGNLLVYPQLSLGVRHTTVRVEHDADLTYNAALQSPGRGVTLSSYGAVAGVGLVAELHLNTQLTGDLSFGVRGGYATPFSGSSTTSGENRVSGTPRQQSGQYLMFAIGKPIGKRSNALGLLSTVALPLLGR